MSITGQSKKSRTTSRRVSGTDTTMKWKAALVDVSPDLIAVTSPARRVLFWGKGAEIATGWSAREAMGKDCFDLLGVSCRNELIDVFAQLIEGRAWEGEFEIVTRANSRRTLLGRWKCIDAIEEMAGNVLLVNSDVTNIKQTRLESLRVLLPDGIRPLASGIAHDLNNVLSPILFGADVLESKCQEPDQLEMVQLIRSCAESGARILRQVLRILREEEGTKGEVEVPQLVGDATLTAGSTCRRAVGESRDV